METHKAVVRILLAKLEVLAQVSESRGHGRRGIFGHVHVVMPGTMSEDGISVP